MSSQPRIVLATMSAMVVSFLAMALGQEQSRPKVGFKDTPMLPGNRWHVHDSDRPFPPVITPGTCSTQEIPGKAPSDAVVLFDGKDQDHWRSDRGGPARWNVEDGALVVRPAPARSQAKSTLAIVSSISNSPPRFLR